MVAFSSTVVLSLVNLCHTLEVEAVDSKFSIDVRLVSGYLDKKSVSGLGLDSAAGVVQVRRSRFAQTAIVAIRILDLWHALLFGIKIGISRLHAQPNVDVAAKSDTFHFETRLISFASGD